MARDKFDVDAWSASDLSRTRGLAPSMPSAGMVQTDGTATDHANALQVAKAMLELRPTTPAVQSAR